jgi:hypothetical protein
MDRPRLGATITCPECGDEFEVVSTDPFDVDYPLDDDWDEEDDEDEDW